MVNIKNLLLLFIIGVYMSFTSIAHCQNSTEKNKQPDLKVATEAKTFVTTLANGLTVHIVEDHRFPLVSTRLYARVGSAYEQKHEAGISHVLEHMVFKGTEKRAVGVISKEVEEVGGYLNAYTSTDETAYEVDVPSKYWALSLDIVKDMAFHPLLDPKELESEKQVIYAEVKMRDENPYVKMYKELQRTTLKGTPYAHPIIGYDETIKAVTSQALRDYIAKYYQPQNMLLLVVGDVNTKETLAKIQELYGDLKNSSSFAPIKAIDAKTLQNAHIEVVPTPWEKAYVGIALPIPGTLELESHSISILAYLLGGDETSYLSKKYEYEKQLVDDIVVANVDNERVGKLYIVAQLDPKNVEIFCKELIADLANIKAENFTEKDIARAKFLIDDATQRTKETYGGLASWIGKSALFYGSEQGVKNIINYINTVDKNELQHAIDNWLVPERLNVVVLAPEEASYPKLAAELKSIWPVKAKENVVADEQKSNKTQVIDLGDGRRVVLHPDATLPYTSIDLVFTGGDSISDRKQGLAALAASTLLTGTKNHDALQIKEYLAERATALSASSGRQVFWVSSNQPSRFNNDIFTLIKDVLSTATFKEDEVQREKAQQISNIRERDDSSTKYAFSMLPGLLFSNEHSYSFKSLGDIPQVEKYTRKEIVDFWQKQAKQPWVLSVAGDFDQKAILEFAKSLPKPSAKTVPVLAPVFNKKHKLDLTMPGREQAHYIMAFPTVAQGHADAAALDILQLALDGFSGLLFNDLRDKQGLGYTVSARHNNYPTTGFFYYYMGTDPEKLPLVQKGFEKSIVDMQNNLLTEDQLLRAKNQLEAGFYMSNQSLGNRSYENALNAILGRDLNFSKQFIEKAKKGTAQEVQKVAKKYINLDKVYVIQVKP